MSKRLLPKNEELIRLYVEEKKSCKEICRMYGLKVGSSTNLGRMLRNLGINIRKDAGENHHNWKGGIITKGDGYIGIWKPNHERADKQGYVYEHTLVYEENYGVLPNKNQVIHHINMNKKDNNIKNLYLCNNKEHLIVHRSLEKLVETLLERQIIKFENGQYKLNK